MRLYVGMDLHSTNCYTGILDEDSKRILSCKLPNDQRRVMATLAPYQDRIEGIAVESTYNWYWLVDSLMQEGYRVHLANPAAMKQYEGIKHLDDRHDAFWLARMLKLGILPEGYIYPRQSRGIRDILRQRSRLVVKRTSLKHSLQQVFTNHTGAILSNQAIEHMDEKAMAKALVGEDQAYLGMSLLSSIGFLKQKVQAIERYVLNRLKGKHPYRSLTTVPGIGEILGLTITLESGPIERFASAGQYASYCRCVPSAYWSNSKHKGSGNKRNGNKYLSWAYAEAANFAIRYCPEAKRYYQRKCTKTHQSSAYRAVANKLAKACFYIMKEKSSFDAKRLFYS